MPKISIAVDAMGGDFAPAAIVEGVGQVLDYHGDRYHIFLVGDQARLEDELRRIGKYGDRRLELVASTQVIEMGEHPVSAIRRKRDSSINVAVDLIRQKRAAALFSAGNTGAVVASAYFRWSMLPGIERPGIAAIFPSEKSRFLLLDAGANVDCTPLNLLHYGLMGHIYAGSVMRKKSPRVGLLCNGTEESKGNRMTQAALKLFQNTKGINFIGNVEGHDLFTDKVDVVVCDGFVGNVMLKSCEQLAVSMGRMVKAQIMKRWLWKIGGLMAKGAFQELRQATDYSEIGGAPLLGVAGACIIGHGVSDAKAVCNGIHAAGNFVRLRVNETITEHVKALNLN